MAEDKWITGRVGLKIGSVPVNLEMTVPATPVTARRMLPVFQQMANACVSAGVESIEQKGEKISCKAGCGACCSQAVPISEVEVYNIAAVVEAMPEPHRSVVKKRFADGVEHFRSIGWFDRMAEVYNGGRAKTSREEMEIAMKVVVDYFKENIPCPFLEEGSCSIYAERPLACREYLVTTPAENCSNLTPETIRLVDLPIKPSRTLNHIVKSGHMRSENMLFLINALELAAKYAEPDETKSGDQWMADFFGHLTKTDVGDLPANASKLPQ